MTKAVRLDSLKKGDLFTVCDHDGEKVPRDIVFVRGDYDRSSRKYVCNGFDGFGRRDYKGFLLVYVNFYGFLD